MASKENWQGRVREKRLEAETIPASWVLPEEVRLSASARNPISVVSVPSTSGLLSQKEIKITENFDAIGLLAQMRDGNLTAYEVTLAFCKRAAIAQQLVHCLTETFYERALQRACELDAYFHKEGKLIGPLHGLPISVKDTFNIKGVHTTIGYVSFIGKPANFNSPLITMLEQQGAVLYVKTNVPQTLFAPDSNNNIFGRTLNPHNLTLTAGGSSGGEGALTAMLGSICGVGSDMAGSIRIPAMCNGVFGFKPTEHRIPYDAQARPDKPGLPGPIYPVAGPIGRSARDMTFFMKTIINADPARYDFLSPPIPWRHVELNNRPLVIGFISECPSNRLSTPIKESLGSARRRLEAVGHHVIDIRDFPNFQDAHDLSYRIFDMDNSETGLRYITDSGEPMVDATKDLNPNYPGGRLNRDLDELWFANAARHVVMRHWHTIFRDNNLDVLLLPGFQSPATPHDTMRSCPYMVMWNLVNYPAGMVPYGRVGPKATEFHNAPCHLQLVAPTFRDEELAAAMETVAKVLDVGLAGSMEKHLPKSSL